ncbi:MAG: TrkA family potassium uptake protein [Deltaproteobacteria bacterium]|jgi:trk system potassium uptake protein TrkA|nr:TrkA family potassium uptake protein [Deltaproteobacteria bacterium]
MKNIIENVLKGITGEPKKEFVVIGLGRFGYSICETLYEYGESILAIDTDYKKIQKIVTDKIVSHAVQVDITDSTALKESGIKDFEVAIVAIGEQIEESIIAVSSLKELGVPYVIAKASSEIHEKLLKKVGADVVIFPEREMGAELARALTKPKLLDWLELDDQNSIAEITVPDSFVNKTLVEVQIRNKYGLNVLALKAKNKFHVNPVGATILEAGWTMIVLGNDKAIDDLAK